MRELYKLMQGSKAWRSNFPHDDDWIIIVDYLENNKNTKFIKDNINDIDILYMTLDYCTKLMRFDFESINKRDCKSLCSLYLEMNNLDFPIHSIDWLKVERQYKTKLRDTILEELDSNGKYLYTHFIIFKMWEYKDNKYREEYREVVDNFKLKRNTTQMKEYIKQQLEVINNE